MAALGPRLQLARQRIRRTEMPVTARRRDAVASASAALNRAQVERSPPRQFRGRKCRRCVSRQPVRLVQAVGASRQVMHTMAVKPDRLVRFAHPGHTLLEWQSLGCGTGSRELDRRRGTPPGTRPMGWQVSWLAGQCTLPPSRPVAGTEISGIGQALAAYSCGGSCGMRPDRVRTAFPYFALLRETVDRSQLTVARPALSM